MVPQPPSTGGMYPPVSAAVAPPGKYPTNTYKPGANNGTQTHVGNHGAYGTYDSSPSIYTNNTMVASGTSVESDDISGSQFKETNVYIAGQQVNVYMHIYEQNAVNGSFKFGFLRIP